MFSKISLLFWKIRRARSHRFISLKPHPLVIAVFMGQEVLCKAAIEVLAWTGVSSEA